MQLPESAPMEKAFQYRHKKWEHCGQTVGQHTKGRWHYGTASSTALANISGPIERIVHIVCLWCVYVSRKCHARHLEMWGCVAGYTRMNLDSMKIPGSGWGYGNQLHWWQHFSTYRCYANESFTSTESPYLRTTVLARIQSGHLTHKRVMALSPSQFLGQGYLCGTTFIIRHINLTPH